MVAPDGKHVLCFNGQIYNYVELRKELSDVFYHSTSDTEVLLHGMARWGVEGLGKLDGMFAFAFYDVSRDQMTLRARPAWH